MGSLTKEEKLHREELAKQGLKVCSKCKRELQFGCFTKNKNSKDGYNSSCKECYAEWHKGYYAEHQEEKKEYARQYKEENREQYLESQKKYRDTHPDRMKQYYLDNIEYFQQWRKEHQDEYYEKNRDRILEYQRQYRKTEHGKALISKRSATGKARRKEMQQNAEGECTEFEIIEMLIFFDYKCAYTGEDLQDGYHIDHVVSLKNGGTNYIWNLVPSNPSPNCSKGAKEMESWFRKQEYFSEERLQRIYEWINKKKQEMETM